MPVLCLGALLLGLVAAPLIPFLPFACAVMTAVLLGAGWAIAAGSTIGGAALSSLALLFACQVGYGLGIVLVAAFTRSASGRRVRDGKETSTPARQFRTGSQPR